MWPFSRKPQQSSDVEQRIEKLERAVRDLRMDWDSTYEKFKTLYARISKRFDRENEQEAPTRPAEAITPPPPVSTSNPRALAILTRHRMG